MGCTGTGKSAIDSRLTWRPAVSTRGVGRLSARRPGAGTPGSSTTATPARRPPGTLMMSPRRNWLSEAIASAR